MPDTRVTERVRALVNAGHRAVDHGTGDVPVSGEGVGPLADACARADDAAEIRTLLERVTFGAVAWGNLASQGRALADLSPQEAIVLSTAFTGMPAGKEGLLALATLAAQAIAGVAHVTTSSFDQVLQELLTRPPARPGHDEDAAQTPPSRPRGLLSRWAPRRARGG